MTDKKPASEEEVSDEKKPASEERCRFKYPGGMICDLIDLQHGLGRLASRHPFTPPAPEKAGETFERALATAINRHSQENGSNTPDFILADFLAGCLRAFATASNAREKWYGVQARATVELARRFVLDSRAFSECNEEHEGCREAYNASRLALELALASDPKPTEVKK